MQVSELIEKLQKAQTKYGDLTVCVSTEDLSLAYERNEYCTRHTDFLDEVVVEFHGKDSNFNRVILKSYDYSDD